MKHPLSATLKVLTVVALLFSCSHTVSNSSSTIAGLQASAVEQQTATSFLEASKSVVLIRCSFTYIYKGISYDISCWGSGFVIGKDLIVTNKHVASPEKFDYVYRQLLESSNGEIVSQKELFIWLPETYYKLSNGELNLSSGIPVIVHKEARDIFYTHNYIDPITGVNRTFTTHALGKTDCLILKAEKELGIKKLRFADISDDHKGSKVYAIGYPRGPRGLETSKVNPAICTSWIRKVEIHIRVQGSILPGASGGPLVLEDGSVIGIIESVSVETETLGNAIKSSDVRSLLNL